MLVQFSLVMMMLSGCVFSADSKNPSVEYLSNDAIRKANLPFSEAVRVGNLLFLSGQLGINPTTGKLATGGVAAETRQTMENIKATLERLGSSMNDIVKCTVFIDDISQWQELNKVYVSYFKKHLPARSALGADGLALGAALEIECIAAVSK